MSDADAPLYFNQASPSAYVRGNTRAVPFALAYMRALQIRGVRVLNGADAFGFDPFERVVDYLVREIRRAARPVPRAATL